MLASSIPAKIPEPWGENAASGQIRPIPDTTTVFGEASWDKGFPPETMQDPSAGGIPPDGRDFNGGLNAISAWVFWIQAGGAPVLYDSSFQTTIGGYPNGAIVGSLTNPGALWRSTADNNTSNPDTGGANWVSWPASAAMGGFNGLIGNASGSTKTASWTIKEIVAGTSAGFSFKGTNLSLNFNGATTGAGGMDTGSVPTSADLNIYAIFNPTTNAWNTLGCTTYYGLNYTGAHMPSGYTASILLWCGKTDSSANIIQFVQVGYTVTIPEVTALTLAGGGSIPVTALNIATWIPQAATFVSGSVDAIVQDGSADAFITLCSDSGGLLGRQGLGISVTPVQFQSQHGSFTALPLPTPQTLFYSAVVTPDSTSQVTLLLSSYRFFQ